MISDALEIINVIVSQHAEESAFLWLLRDLAVHEPHYSLKDLAKLDNRVEAHIDGLRIAGDEGWEICKEQLSWEEPGEVFAAAVLAFESGDQGRIDKVLGIGVLSRELSRGIISAQGWITYKEVKKYIKKFLQSDNSVLRRIGLAASAVHRQDPGEALITAMDDEDPSLKARALRAVGELGRVDLIPNLKQRFTAENTLCRFAAAWSAALLGDDDVPYALKSLFMELEDYEQEEAVKTGLRKMGMGDANRWLEELKTDQEQLRLAIMGAGAIGDPGHIPWLMEMMEVDEYARIAGESFTMITGVDIAYEDLEGEWPEGFEAGPTENPEDEDVEMDPDEDLPWPEPELIREWWKEHQSDFQSGTRYLVGKPITPDWLQQVLRNGMQRQRAAAALELAMANPGQPLFEVRAPGFRQQEMLGI